VDEVISYMLEVERQADEVVAEAERKARDIRRAGHEAAQAVLDEARRGTREQVAEFVAKKSADAERERDRVLAEFDEELQALRAEAQDRHDDAAQAAFDVLSGIRT